MPVSEELRRAIREELDRTQGNQAVAARNLGIPRTRVWETAHDLGMVVKRPRRSQALVETPEAVQVQSEVEKPVRTELEALNAVGLDPSDWKVKKVRFSAKDVNVKGEVRQLRTITVDAERILSRPFLQATEALFRRMEKYAPSYETPDRHTVVDPCMLEVDLFDVHFGKLAWARETGEDYDLRIAEVVFRDAVEDLLAISSPYDVDLIVFPVGNDFFHVDNLRSATTSGTTVDSDGRYAKIIEVGEMAFVHAIEAARAVAPVKVILVPGNHDRVASLHLARFLMAWFRNDPNVEVDCGPSTRKYHRYGTNLIGYAHGDEVKLSDLPLIMATESPAHWAETTCREWRTGHLHHSRRTEHMSVAGFKSVEVRVLKSLSATDDWHYHKGYIGVQRAAEAFLHSFRDGFLGQFVAPVRSA